MTDEDALAFVAASMPCNFCGDVILRSPSDSLARWLRKKYCSRKCAADSFRVPAILRFWDKVDKKTLEECWLWTAGIQKQGYGSISQNGTSVLAHRLSWEIHYGTIPNGLCVLHKCDVPRCVNPSHLFLGSIADNNQDKMMKGRHIVPCGMEHWKAKIHANDIPNIRSDARSHSEIAADYDVQSAAIWKIKNRRTWKHIR